MNPSYGIILWIIIGALAGWIGSKIMGTDRQQGGFMNILVGVVGAVIGGFLARNLLGDMSANNGFIASFFVALLGSVVLIGVVRALRGRTA
jgi:uncharacterized membrane protein YeaQ/YmgE (transglycosylase-associated protein family)